MHVLKGGQLKLESVAARRMHLLVLSGYGCGFPPSTLSSNGSVYL